MTKRDSCDWAALFDWDGVIVDSSRLHALSWDLLAAEEGLLLPGGHFTKGFGRKNEEIIPEILGWSSDPAEIRRLADAKEEFYRASVKSEGLEILPGVRAWLDILKAAGVPCVIGSSTVRANIDVVLDVLGLRGYFSDIVSGGDVKDGKPHPAIFLRAAQLSGHAPSRCVVFEDAVVGIQAARAGGMSVVAVTTTSPAAALSNADLVVDRLDELRLAQMTDLVDSAVADCS
jgi:beta-phosphoglucomutase family hydrolase